MVLRTASLSRILSAVLSWLKRNPAEHEIYKIYSFPHPSYSKELTDAGAYEIDYIYSFELYSLEEGSFPEIDASRWYITSGD